MSEQLFVDKRLNFQNPDPKFNMGYVRDLAALSRSLNYKTPGNQEKIDAIEKWINHVSNPPTAAMFLLENNSEAARVYGTDVQGIERLASDIHNRYNELKKNAIIDQGLGKMVEQEKNNGFMSKNEYAVFSGEIVPKAIKKRPAII